MTHTTKRRARRIGVGAIISGALAMAGACSEDAGKGEEFAMENHAKIVDNVPPEARIEGAFEQKIRVYGYIVEAKAGAKIHLDLATRKGETKNGLDTVLRVNGPFVSVREPGAILAESEDGADSYAAPPLDFAVERDGQYLVSFSTWDDPTGADYELSLQCTGTDFQCRRAELQRDCKDGGPLYIQGREIADDTEWDRCEVVLLEPVTVAAGKTLTIHPGVHVKANFLGTAPFGNVVLDVAGRLQALGTEANPILFTAFTEMNGWGGLRLRGQGHTLTHAVVEKAETGIELFSAQGEIPNATIEDVLVDAVSFGNVRPRDGVRSLGDDSDIVIRRSVIQGATNGVNVGNAERFVVEDSVIRDNQVGVLVSGPNAVTQCQPQRPPRPANTPPPFFRPRDPVFLRTDIIHNQTGMRWAGADLLVQVSQCNIQHNTVVGVEVQGWEIHGESFVRESNIHTNGTNGKGRDVVSLHRQGALDISGNYWIDISDPDLSASWQSSCNTNGAFSFTGFSPTPLESTGPKELSPELRRYALDAPASPPDGGDD